MQVPSADEERTRQVTLAQHLDAPACPTCAGPLIPIDGSAANHGDEAVRLAEQAMTEVIDAAGNEDDPRTVKVYPAEMPTLDYKGGRALWLIDAVEQTRTQLRAALEKP